MEELPDVIQAELERSSEEEVSKRLHTLLQFCLDFEEAHGLPPRGSNLVAEEICKLEAS